MRRARCAFGTERADGWRGAIANSEAMEDLGELFDDEQSLVSIAEGRTRLEFHQKGISNKDWS